MHVHVHYLAKIPARCVEYIQCAKILRMRKIEVTRTWYRVVSVVQSIAIAHKRMGADLKNGLGRSLKITLWW